MSLYEIAFMDDDIMTIEADGYDVFHDGAWVHFYTLTEARWQSARPRAPRRYDKERVIAIPSSGVKYIKSSQTPPESSAPQSP